MTGGLEFGPGVLSPHPADVLMRELIATRREAGRDEVAAIVARMASAPFDPQMVGVRVAHRGLRLHGQTLERRATSLFYHLVKRVLLDKQWPPTTSEQAYLNDLRSAITAPAARHTVYYARGGHIAAALAATSGVLPPARRATEPQPWLAVFYSADHGHLISGYQVSDLTEVRIPEEALWLT